MYTQGVHAVLLFGKGYSQLTACGWLSGERSQEAVDAVNLPLPSLSHTNHTTPAQYYEQLTHMLQLAEGIPYHHLQGRAVAVLLGSSVARPREVYCLHFPAAMHQPGEGAAVA